MELSVKDFIKQKNDLIQELDTIKSIGYLLSISDSQVVESYLSNVGLALMKLVDNCLNTLGENK